MKSAVIRSTGKKKMTEPAQNEMSNMCNSTGADAMTSDMRQRLMQASRNARSATHCRLLQVGFEQYAAIQSLPMIATSAADRLSKRLAIQDN